MRTRIANAFDWLGGLLYRLGERCYGWADKIDPLPHQKLKLVPPPDEAA